LGTEAPANRSGIHVVVLSGLSGSGKTTALHALEDAGFFCVDNLPSALVEPFMELARGHEGVPRVAISVDVRERLFDADWARTLAELERRHRLSVLFLDADDEALTNRFKTTRRPHPLVARLGAAHGAASLAEAFALERAWLTPFRQQASLLIDTTKLTVHELRRRVTQAYGEGPAPKLTLQLMSFGFRHGLPAEADFVFDARYLDNPYFVPELRDRTGLERDVSDFVLRQPLAERLLAQVTTLLGDILPAVEAEGRVSLTVAIGCTGGQHRSVALIEALAKTLVAGATRPVQLTHRDLPRT
jgi:UPF0042 nucleotide-binding protein